MAESLGSFSFDVTKRILCTLVNDGSIKKTSLSHKNSLKLQCMPKVHPDAKSSWMVRG